MAAEPWAACARTLVAAADARAAWVETGILPARLKPRGGGPPCPAPCGAILHVLRRWTREQHFVKSIWRVDVLGEDGGDCTLRHLLRKHVVDAAESGGDAAETDRLAEWALWEGPQWAAVAEAAATAEAAAAAAAEGAPNGDGNSLQSVPDTAKPAEVIEAPGQPRQPGPGREESLCEACGKMVMVSELAKHNAGKKHRRALRLAAAAADAAATTAVTGPIAGGPAAPTAEKIAAPAPEPEPEPELELAAQEDPNLEEISRHRAVFGPLALSGLNAEEARRFVLPYDYPKARAYAITFREYATIATEAGAEAAGDERKTQAQKEQAQEREVVKATVTMELLPFSFVPSPADDAGTQQGQRGEGGEAAEAAQQSSKEPESSDGTAAAAAMPVRHMGAGARRVLATLLQWAATTDTASGRSTHGMCIHSHHIRHSQRSTCMLLLVARRLLALLSVPVLGGTPLLDEVCRHITNQLLWWRRGQLTRKADEHTREYACVVCLLACLCVQSSMRCSTSQ